MNKPRTTALTPPDQYQTVWDEDKERDPREIPKSLIPTPEKPCRHRHLDEVEDDDWN